MELYNYWTQGAVEGQKLTEAVPVRLMPGGLDRIVPDAFLLLSSGVFPSAVTGGEREARTEEHMKPVSGEKLVYSINMA